MIYTATYLSPIGELTLASDGASLTGLWLAGQKYFAAGLPDAGAVSAQETAVLRAGKSWLEHYFAGDRPSPLALPLAPGGSSFRQAVLPLLCQIPYGEVISYGELAAQAAQQLHRQHMAARAVGNAVTHNPISIIIPCHRVVGAHGSLTGYAGGLERKIWLLAHEGIDVSRFNRPSQRTAR